MLNNTISMRELSRNSKRILDRVKRTKKPIIVISKNRPQVAVIDIDLLEEIRLNQVLQEALEEHRRGKTTVIDTKEKLLADFEETLRQSGAK